MARAGTPPVPRVQKVGDWKAARRVLPGFDQFYRQAEIDALTKEAEFFRKKVLEAFKTSGTSNGRPWAPNTALTAKSKGSAKPLVDTGDLMGAISVMSAGGPGEFFVGIPNNIRTKDGMSMSNLAEVHEFGKVIVMQITPKQHRFFMAKLAEMGMAASGSGGGNFRPGATLVIHIPARSFIGATAEAHFEGGKSERRVQQRISRAIRSKVGSTVRGR